MPNLNCILMKDLTPWHLLPKKGTNKQAGEGCQLPNRRQLVCFALCLCVYYSVCVLRLPALMMMMFAPRPSQNCSRHCQRTLPTFALLCTQSQRQTMQTILCQPLKSQSLEILIPRRNYLNMHCIINSLTLECPKHFAN